MSVSANTIAINKKPIETESSRVLAYLRSRCIGIDNAVTSKHLETLFNIKGQRMRQIINHLRTNHAPVCSNAKGYRYAATDAEVVLTVKHMRNRIKGILNAIEGLEAYLSTSATVQHTAQSTMSATASMEK